MPKGIIGRKLGMTQVFDEFGNMIPVTVVSAGPCTVVRKKAREGSDGYDAVVLGFEPAHVSEHEGEKVVKLDKPRQGVYRNAGIETPMKHSREIRLWPGDLDNYEVGQQIDATQFIPGDIVDVIGTSKGRGFAGVMKRHGMAGFKASHGTHEYFRHGGSIGMSASPARVVKGKRMAGQYGNKRITAQNRRIVEVNTDENVLLIRGGIPGPTGGLVVVRDAIKLRRRPRG